LAVNQEVAAQPVGILQEGDIPADQALRVEASQAEAFQEEDHQAGDRQAEYRQEEEALQVQEAEEVRDWGVTHPLSSTAIALMRTPS
jgi:hypothetical protein